MIKVASLTRKGFIAGDISTVMSQGRYYIAENAEIFKDIGYAFRVTFKQMMKLKILLLNIIKDVLGKICRVLNKYSNLNEQ